MTETLAFTWWCISIGTLLLIMTMSSPFIARLPLSAAMLYLLVGYALGPAGIGLLQLHPQDDVGLLERLTEVAVLISLFSAGFKLELPLNDRRWRIPLQLASTSMLLTVAGLTVAGMLLFDLSLGAALLMGAILAPTDPVLASDVQVADPGDGDPLRFGLTGEGGLNDGTAFPLLMLGLGLLGLHEMGSGGWRWVLVDVIWAIGAGIGIGYVLGRWTGRAVLYLRKQHKEEAGVDEFMAFGLIALSYGLALLCHAYGFLAVFAAGLALCRARKEASREDRSEAGPQMMMNTVNSFNSQLEHFAEVAIVLALGALISSVEFDWLSIALTVLLFVVIRPLAVFLGLWGTGASTRHTLFMAWFGIRGIGSLYYLMYAIGHGLDPQLAHQLLTITCTVVVASVIAHGVSVTPLMNLYQAHRSRRKD